MKNHGIIRGGNNVYHRLSLKVHMDQDETTAMAMYLAKRFGLEVYASTDCVYLYFDTHMEFSLVPAVVRLCHETGRGLSIAHWDGESRCMAEYPDAQFFEAVAEAACFVEE